MLKKILPFFKKHWSEIVLILVVVVLGIVAWRQHVSLSLYDNFMNIYNQQSEDFKKQIEAINKIQEENDKFKEKLEQEYRENLLSLDQKYKSDLDKLSKKLTSDKQVLIQEGMNDPCTLLQLFIETYGSEPFDGVITKCQ